VVVQGSTDHWVADPTDMVVDEASGDLVIRVSKIAVASSIFIAVPIFALFGITWAVRRALGGAQAVLENIEPRRVCPTRGDDR
jgi:hypothetical protein